MKTKNEANALDDDKAGAVVLEDTAVDGGPENGALSLDQTESTEVRDAVPIRGSQLFSVADVLTGALNESLASVVVIARYNNGRMYVASSQTTEHTESLINEAIPYIESLT